MTTLLNSSTSGPASIPLHEGIINNKQTNAPKGMPFKPDTMDQGNVFSIGRMAFARMNTQMSAKPPTAAEITATRGGFGGGNGFTGGLITKMGDLKSKNQLVGKGSKNWCGSSSYTENKRRVAIGKGSMNTSLPTTLNSFSALNKNDVRSAIAKCRGGGCVAPAKKGAA